MLNKKIWATFPSELRLEGLAGNYGSKIRALIVLSHNLFHDTHALRFSSVLVKTTESLTIIVLVNNTFVTVRTRAHSHAHTRGIVFECVQYTRE